MTPSNICKPLPVLTLLLGLAIGSLATYFMGAEPTSMSATDEKKPLYWVAPMDDNYRRDKPGLSPMGMALVPVYDQATPEHDAGPGTITISPNVINNLGVRTTTVVRKKLKEDIHTVGYVTYDENKLIHIHPRVSGWIDKLYVKASGDPVNKGQALYSLYSPELVNAQEELLLALNRNNTRLIEAAQNRLAALHIPLEFVQTLKRTKTVKPSITFYSPQEGVVDNLNIREGFYVQPGTTLFSIGALDKVWVDVEIFERQAAQVTKGAPVTMTLDYLPGHTWEGKVDYIYPKLDPQTRTVRLRVPIDNPDTRLLPNMFTHAVIHNFAHHKRLLVPRESVIRTGQQNRVVLALGEGSFKSIAVTLGRENQQYVEVLEGLTEGEKIVSSAQFLLDSESSKTSDFTRIDSPDETAKSVWVPATIEAQLPDSRQVRARHDAIAQWNMMAMTMNFDVAQQVDFDALQANTSLHMHITLGDNGVYEIIETHILNSPHSDKTTQTSGTATQADTVHRADTASKTENAPLGDTSLNTGLPQTGQSQTDQTPMHEHHHHAQPQPTHNRGQ